MKKIHPYHGLKRIDMTYLSRKFNHLVLSLLTIGLFNACSDPKYDTDGQTTTIKLQLPELERQSRVAGTDEENAIHTLRVIILSQTANSINQLFTTDDLTNGSVTIDNVPVGNVQIYVIANEASLGKNYNDLTNLQQDVVTTSTGARKLLIQDLSRKYFPKRGSELAAETAPNLKGIPMGWENRNQNIDPPGSLPQVININLERQVAKLNIVMNNTLTEAITITSVTFGEFFCDRFYFYRESQLDVPDNAIYDNKTYEGLHIEIPGGESATLVCYVYPSFAWKDATESSPYTIGFSTQNGGYYAPQNFINEFGALNSILRNTQVNIYATLSKSANINIKFSVTPWDEKKVEIPPFE